MTPRTTPGRRLRSAMDQALQRAAEQRGQQMSWDEHDLELIDRAAAAADLREQIEKRLAAKLDSDADTREITALSSEIRQLNRLVSTFMARLMKGLEPPKDARQKRAQRAAHYRWAQEARQAVAEGGE